MWLPRALSDGLGGDGEWLGDGGEWLGVDAKGLGDGGEWLGVGGGQRPKVSVVRQCVRCDADVNIVIYDTVIFWYRVSPNFRRHLKYLKAEVVDTWRERYTL